ncbi:carbamoyl-phosphate synthase small subunit [Longimicrobium terrae]|uniref:Carbamoyl phosphate synthase small chain n=2 Tax=Longimicrobium terrae TaxID=1639882 RepID=A0A841H5U0_9BACT|nr:carbamoyl-phosphate synthase small subunit [Longimicrobium terrae]MBB6073447.1 carbamoyl-phosphate synthase small subunit [Longimicrobium terrae]
MAESVVLMLEDGRVFRGEAYGARGDAFGEVVFNTSMTGYQEVLTDPSYSGQIVTMTYPLIGNYGVNAEDEESAKPQVAAFVFHEAPPMHSNWRAAESLDEYLTRHGVVAITGVDTRALTRHIRSRGAMRGAIAPASILPDELLGRIMGQPDMAGLNLADGVSTESRYVIPAVGETRYRVLAYDFGVKSHSLKLLAQRGCEVTVLPAATPTEEIVAAGADGLFVSNGPGDPEAVGHALDAIRALSDEATPVFGICLGHQLIARAFGAETYKLKYGHRGGNHPVRRISDGAVEITAQNHGFAVRGDESGIPGAPGLRVTHLNLNDGTVEGLEHRERPVFSVQYHPEAAPGPHDSVYLFDRFVDEMTRRAAEMSVDA